MYSAMRNGLVGPSYQHPSNPSTTTKCDVSKPCHYDEPPIDYSEDDDEQEESCKKGFGNCIMMASFHANELPEINFNQLRFDSLLGQGGFGKVHRAKYDDLWVAVKEPIYYDRSQTININRAIVEEARLHYHLRHPNIIQLHGISLRGEKVFLVMEYAHGKSLRELLNKRTLSPNVIIKFAIQISSAMEYLHNFKPRAIIHRDLKSPNILLNEPITDGNWRNKQLKLTDLGLAQEFTHSTKMSQCGTYAWMAPESITNSKFSKSSDVWSFGVVLWELLTGQIPYRDFSGPAIAFGIGNGRLTLPIPNTCPDELKIILKSCWQSNSKLRPSFSNILVQLQNCSFNVVNLEQFQKMKQNWFVEIENIWQNLKEKEKELESREEEAKRKEEETKRKAEEVELMKLELKQQSEELRRREIEVVSRELHVLLQQQVHVNNSGSSSAGKQLKRRHSRRKLNASNNIGYPHNFCHQLTITSSHDHQHVPMLQARALNKTWGPGTKVRPELQMNIFEKSCSNFKSNSQDINHNDHGTYVEGKPHKTKKMSFLKRIFGTSKSNLNKLIMKNDSAEGIDHEGIVICQTDKDEDYARMESVKLQQKALSRTYHGQTKHSQRKQLDLYEHFQQCLCGHHHHHHHNHLKLDDENYDSSEEQKICCQQNKCDQAVDGSKSSLRNYHHLDQYEQNSTQQQDHNNNTRITAWPCEPCSNLSLIYMPSWSRSNSTQNNSKSTISTSEHDFDADLLQELNRFEQEFQSMNCTSA